MGKNSKKRTANIAKRVKVFGDSQEPFYKKVLEPPAATFALDLYA